VNLLFQFEDALNRTNLDTHRLVKMPFALNAGFRIDYIDLFTLGDGLCGAFRFASTAVDAVLVDVKRHFAS